MATATPEETKSEAEEVAAPPAKDGFLMKVIIVGVLLILVMGLQFFILWYFLGGESADTQQPNGDVALDDTPTIGDPSNPGNSNTVEVEVDNFNCANGIASQGFTIHISFRLVAIVSSNSETRFYDAVHKEHKFRVHQAVDKVIRSSSQEDLKDANLDRIKRRIREDVNKVLGNSYIQDVIVTEFRMMEQ